MERFSEKIIRLRWVIILLVIILTAFFGYYIKYLKINSDVLSSLPDSDPAALLYKNIGDEFGSNNIGMVVLETDNIFKADVIEHVKQITDSLKVTEGVSNVTSITSILDIKSTEEGLEIGKLVDEYNLPATKSQLDSLKNYVFSKDMYKGNIISEDGTATLIIFTLFQDVDNQTVAKNIKQKVGLMNLPETIYFGGVPMMLNGITDLIVSDLVWLIPISFFIIALVLLLSFRSLRGIIMPLLNTGIAIIWTMGLLVLMGYELTIISNVIPVVLLAVGSAYTIHVLNSVNLNKSTDKKQSLIKALAYIIIPVTLAALTTAIGFVSFIFGAYLTMIKDFGLFTALGTVFALILSIFFVPAIISLFPGKKLKNEESTDNGKGVITQKILSPIVTLLFRHPKYILTTWVFVLLLSISGAFFIKISVNIIEYFKKDSETRVSENILQEKFGGSTPVFIVFEGDMQSPEVLKIMSETAQFMEEDAYIANTQSVADLVEQMNDAMGEGLKIPDDKAKIEQLWFLLDGQDVMSQLVSEDLQKGIIQTRYATTESKPIKEFIAKMDKFIKENSSENCRISLTGMTSVYMKINDSLINSQFSSLVIAILLVIVIVGLIVRSFIKGVWAAIPIIATIIILFGFMGVAGIHLDIATALVGSIVLGVGVDYSIHIITGFNYHMKESGNDLKMSIEKTILLSGKAVIINVFSVTAGFLVLIFSQLIPLQHFGILIAICMLGSGIGALTLLPVILILANRKKSKSVLNSKK